MSKDFETALVLLQVADLAKQWPNLKGLEDAALSQLVEFSHECSEVAKARRERTASEVMKQAVEKADRAEAEHKAEAHRRALSERPAAPVVTERRE